MLTDAPKNFHTSTVATILFLFVLITTASAQQLHLKSTHAGFTGTPQSDRGGSLWVWRNAEGLLLASPTGARIEKVSGSFIQQRVSIASNAVMAMAHVADAENGRGDKAGLRLLWYSRAGRPLGTYALARHEDDPLPQFVMNHESSYAMMIEPASTRATFLKSSGQVLAQNLLFKDASYSNERPVFLAASAKYFFVLSQRAPTTEQEAHVPTLFCFALEGEEQWRRELQTGTAGNLACSPHGTWLLASAYQVAASSSRVIAGWSLFDTQGKPIANGPGTFRAAAFSADEKQVILMEREQLRCFSISSNQTLWQLNLEERNKMFVAAVVAQRASANFALVATSVFKQNRFVYEDAALLEIDNAGNLKHTLPVTPTLFEPQLLLSADEKTLLLAAEGLLQRYEVFAKPQPQSKE